MSLWFLPWWLSGKEAAGNAGDEGSISGSVLTAHDSIRLTELKYIIDELHKYYDRREEPEIKKVLLEGSLYLQSTLQAYNLFITYYNSPIQVKKEILSTIQSLFNQEHTLEELLSRFDISLESSIDNERIKNYIRR